MKGFWQCAATMTAMLLWPALANAAIITIAEPRDEVSPITVTAVGVPPGAPGITNIIATAESITFNYDDNVIKAHTVELDAVMLEADGNASDVVKNFETQNQSLQMFSFFSDDGAGLPATCTPSITCLIGPPVLETCGPDLLLQIDPSIFVVSDVDVPEPDSIWLLGIGLVALAAIRRRNAAEPLVTVQPPLH
jgi:hypothetical protein